MPKQKKNTQEPRAPFKKARLRPLQKSRRQFRKRLTRADIVRTLGAETVEDLEKRIAEGGPASDVSNAVPLERLHVAEKVFQWRLDKRNELAKEDHILTLTKALLNQNAPLDPILVFPVGKRLYVVDGHHRVYAYHTAKWTKPIPVEVFRGTLKEARLEGMRRNNKDKLPMTGKDKHEAAWALVKETLLPPGQWALSISEMVDLTKVGHSQVSNMRAVYLKLKDDKEHAAAVDAYSWPNARAAANGAKPQRDDDEWRNAMIEDIVKRFKRGNFGDAFVKYPDMVAEAIARLDDNLPRRFAEAWFGPEDLIEMGEEALEEAASF